MGVCVCACVCACVCTPAVMFRGLAPAALSGASDSVDILGDGFFSRDLKQAGPRTTLSPWGWYCLGYFRAESSSLLAQG